MRKIAMWAAIAVAVVGIGVLAFSPAGGVKTVDTAGVLATQQSGAQLIDVRTVGEFDLGHIPGAKNVPLDTLQSAAPSWDQAATYVVYCATGVRSAEAVTILTSLGFRNLEHFSAGFNSWSGEVEKGSGTGAGTPAPVAQKIETSGKPTVLEFYTDA